MIIYEEYYNALQMLRSHYDALRANHHHPVRAGEESWKAHSIL